MGSFRSPQNVRAEFGCSSSNHMGVNSGSQIFWGALDPAPLDGVCLIPGNRPLPHKSYDGKFGRRMSNC